MIEIATVKLRVTLIVIVFAIGILMDSGDDQENDNHNGTNKTRRTAISIVKMIL